MPDVFSGRTQPDNLPENRPFGIAVSVTDEVAAVVETLLSEKISHETLEGGNG